MPIIVEKTVKAREVRVGDEVLFPGKTYSELVADRDPKRVYTTISTDYGSTRIELDAEVTVYREELTEEEIAANRVEQENLWIRESMMRAATRVETYREELIENLHIRSVSWHGRSWESYAEAQISAQLWEDVVKVAVNHKISLRAAVKKWAEKLTEDLIGEIKFGARGGSVMHSLSKDLVNQVHAAWLDDLRRRID